MKHLGSEILFSVPPCWCSRKLARCYWAYIARVLDSRGSLLAEQLSWTAEPWVPGAWDLQLFLQGKLLGRGRDRVPLGAWRRAVSASCSPEGNTLPPLRRNGSSPQPPCGRSATCRNVCIPQPGLLSPLRDHSAPAPLTESPEPACADWTTLLDTVPLTLKRSCQFFLLLPFST